MIFKKKEKKRRWPWILGAIAVAFVVALLVTAWPFLTYPTVEVSTTLPEPRPAENLEAPVAGVASTDITPPMGIPRFGYSAWARKADGFRTRLKARAFYLHAPDDTPMALVQLDLGSGSLILHHRVAELIAAETDVPAHALSLLSTHTHSGPGHYLGSNFYNVFGTNKPGFDPKLFDFLARQIADAVIRAYRDRRPAKVALGQTEVLGFTRNRSIAAWGRNHGLDEEDLTPEMPFLAVNPRLTMVRLDLRGDDGAFHPAGAFTAFSIHGTGIPAFTRPYHADVWAWLARDLENHIRRRYDSPFEPVHGPFQATHGDNTPAWRPEHRGDRESRRIGEGLAEAAISLYEDLGDKLTGELETATASRQTDLLEIPEDQRHGLCPRAIVGSAVVAGANGDEVFPISYIPWIQEGWPRRVFTGGCQGVKHWMLSKLQLALPAGDMPHRALFQILRINELVLAPVPWEVTFESGNRMREAIREVLPPGDWTVEISSVANGYLGYATTPEEYRAQYYEGGHTLYGPGTLPFMTAFARTLTADLFTRGEVAELPATATRTLMKKQYWPEKITPPGRRRILAEPRFHAPTEDDEPYWSFRYQGLPPENLTLHEPLLRIERRTDKGWQPLTLNGLPVNDQGTDLQIMLRGRKGDAGIYEVRWYNPHFDTNGDLRFHLASRGATAPLTSAAFR